MVTSMSRTRRILITSIAGIAVLGISLQCVSFGQTKSKTQTVPPPDTAGFWDGTHHWYDIADEVRIINPSPNQPRYRKTDVAPIAENILLYQKDNGGWPKNYDMLAILTPEQKDLLQRSRAELNTTFDNGATHEQIQYLARAYQITGKSTFREACLKGLDFILAAQYGNGGWPQFYPDTSGYRKYITFNDGAMIGIMRVLADIRAGKKHFAFVDDVRRSRLRQAFDKGIQVILRCQILQDGVPTAWCQQHDNVDFRPQHARSYELPSITGLESSEIVHFLMGLPNPTREISAAIRHAVTWFRKSEIHGIRIEEIKAPHAEYMYHSTDMDKVVVNDPNAPTIWARFYELTSNRPFMCNRNGKPVYSLADVERERRTGYAWYTYDPQRVLDAYPKWQKEHPGE